MLEALSFRDKCISMHRKNTQSVKQEAQENWKTQPEVQDLPEETHFIEEEHLIEDENIPIERLEEDYQLSHLDDDTLNISQSEEPSTEVKPAARHKIKENRDGSRERRKRKSYVSSEKLKIIAYAEVTGNRQAGKEFNIDESLVRKWRGQKNLLLQITQSRDTKRKPNLRFPEVEERLKEFVENKIAEGVHLQPREIKAEAVKIANEMEISNFKGTSSYIFKFMERYKYTKKHKT